MAILGAILLVLGVILSIKILFWIGVVLLCVGLVLVLMSASGHAVGGRNWF